MGTVFFALQWALYWRAKNSQTQLQQKAEYTYTYLCIYVTLQILDLLLRKELRKSNQASLFLSYFIFVRLVVWWLSHMSSDFLKLAVIANTRFFDMNRYFIFGKSNLSFDIIQITTKLWNIYSYCSSHRDDSNFSDSHSFLQSAFFGPGKASWQCFDERCG